MIILDHKSTLCQTVELYKFLFYVFKKPGLFFEINKSLKITFNKSILV
jgi:hypothetical protein